MTVPKPAQPVTFGGATDGQRQGVAHSSDFEEMRARAEAALADARWVKTPLGGSSNAEDVLALLARVEAAQRERDSFEDALTFERSLNESVVAPMRERVVALEIALGGLLEWAERYRGGDKSLDPEEYYIARDYARIALKPLAQSEGLPPAPLDTPAKEDGDE